MLANYLKFISRANLKGFQWILKYNKILIVGINPITKQENICCGNLEIVVSLYFYFFLFFNTMKIIKILSFLLQMINYKMNNLGVAVIETFNSKSICFLNELRQEFFTLICGKFIENMLKINRSIVFMRFFRFHLAERKISKAINIS